jgi:hypothetical protein
MGPYYSECREITDLYGCWRHMVVSVASYVIVGWVEGERLDVFPLEEFSAFSKTDFLYTALHYLHGICLCKYHNSRSH